MNDIPSVSSPRCSSQRRGSAERAWCSPDPGVPGDDLRGVAGRRRPGERQDALQRRIRVRRLRVVEPDEDDGGWSDGPAEPARPHPQGRGELSNAGSAAYMRKKLAPPKRDLTASG